jgi:Holliday junction DNA helicase RuvA
VSTFLELPEVGVEVQLHTHLMVRDDAHLLYAFHGEAEKRLFRELLRISGIGAKLALAILSGMNVEEFGRCVREANSAALSRLPGIGRKTADRLLVEMRDRLEQWAPSMSLPADSPAPTSTAAREEAISGLLSLGYKAAEAERLLASVDPESMSSGEIIRAALKASLDGDGRRRKVAR